MMFALVRYGARLHDKVATNVLKQKRHSSDGLVTVKSDPHGHAFLRCRNKQCIPQERTCK